MIASLTIDPTTALSLSPLDPDDFAHAQARQARLRRRQRRFQAHARIRRLLA